MGWLSNPRGIAAAIGPYVMRCACGLKVNCTHTPQERRHSDHYRWMDRRTLGYQHQMYTNTHTNFEVHTRTHMSMSIYAATVRCQINTLITGQLTSQTN